MNIGSERERSSPTSKSIRHELSRRLRKLVDTGTLLKNGERPRLSAQSALFADGADQ